MARDALREPGGGARFHSTHMPTPTLPDSPRPTTTSAGRTQGHTDGAALGTAHGFTLGREVGAALGAARAAVALAALPGGPPLPARGARAAAALATRAAAVPLDSPQSEALSDALDAVRSKRRVLEAATGGGGGRREGPLARLLEQLTVVLVFIVAQTHKHKKIKALSPTHTSSGLRLVRVVGGRHRVRERGDGRDVRAARHGRHHLPQRCPGGRLHPSPQLGVGFQRGH